MISPESPACAPRMASNISLANLTSFQVGGDGDWFAQVYNLQQLEQADAWAKRRGLSILFIGEGTNILFPDQNFHALVLQNCIKGTKCSGNEVEVGGGENLDQLIRWLNRQNLAGMECMYGIPGTVAGAVVGNAGAYGQEISDSVMTVRVWSANQVKTFTVEETEFRYRHSVFKDRRDCFILSCRLRLRKSWKKLQQISDAILSKRREKYAVGLKCPGSFFKNVLMRDLSPEVIKAIPHDCIQFGKIPAGKLLELVGAKGARRGDAQFADYHANLMINLGRASSEDILSLAYEYADRVRDRFRIRLEPEIQVVNNESAANLGPRGS